MRCAQWELVSAVLPCHCSLVRKDKHHQNRARGMLTLWHEDEMGLVFVPWIKVSLRLLLCCITDPINSALESLRSNQSRSLKAKVQECNKLALTLKGRNHQDLYLKIAQSILVLRIQYCHESKLNLSVSEERLPKRDAISMVTTAEVAALALVLAPAAAAELAVAVGAAAEAASPRLATGAGAAAAAAWAHLARPHS